MASKKELFASAMELCEAHGASNELVSGLTDLLAPKAGGATVNVEEVYNESEDLLLCSVSGAWLPATEEYFYEDKSGKSQFNGLKRLSRQAESIRKTFIKTQRVSETAIMNDVLDGAITPEDGKEMVADLKANKPDFSSVE